MRHPLSTLPPIAAVILFVGLNVTAGLIPTPAAAQNEDAQNACTPDVFRLCNEFVPDRGRITACLRKHTRQLSKECRVVMAGSKKRVRHHRR